MKLSVKLVDTDPVDAAELLTAMVSVLSDEQLALYHDTMKRVWLAAASDEDAAKADLRVKAAANEAKLRFLIRTGGNAQ